MTHRWIGSFNKPLPPGDRWVFYCRPCPGDGKSEPSLAGVGNLYRKCQVFPADYTCFIAKYGGVNTSFSRANVPEVKRSTRSRVLKLGKRVESYGRWVFLFFKKVNFGRAFEQITTPGAEYHYVYVKSKDISMVLGNFLDDKCTLTVYFSSVNWS